MEEATENDGYLATRGRGKNQYDCKYLTRNGCFGMFVINTKEKFDIKVAYVFKLNNMEMVGGPKPDAEGKLDYEIILEPGQRKFVFLRPLDLDEHAEHSYAATFTMAPNKDSGLLSTEGLLAGCKQYGYDKIYKDGQYKICECPVLYSYYVDVITNTHDKHLTFAFKYYPTKLQDLPGGNNIEFTLAPGEEKMVYFKPEVRVFGVIVGPHVKWTNNVRNSTEAEIAMHNAKGN